MLHVQERHVLSCEEISLAHSALLHSCNVPANHIINMAEGLYVIPISYVTRKAPIEPFNQLQEASFFFSGSAHDCFIYWMCSHVSFEIKYKFKIK